MDLSKLRRSADLIAGSVRKATRPAPAPMWGEWATVVSGSGPTVLLDSDWEQVARPVAANAFGTVSAGQRVYVTHQGPSVTIVNAPGRPPNSVRIGGTDYAASGAWAQQTLSSPAYSSAPIYAWTLAKTAPFAPPSGWGFAIDLRASDGYTTVGMGSYVSGTCNVRVININSSSPTIRLGWRLVAE